MPFQCEGRRKKLIDSHDFQRFLSDFRNLSAWVSSMQALVSSDELAKDSSGAESLLERHQEHRTEIDTRAAAFNAFDSFGAQLLARQHFANSEIQDKMKLLKKDKAAVEK